MNFWDKTKEFMGGRASAAKAYLAQQKSAGDTARAKLPQMDSAGARQRLRATRDPQILDKAMMATPMGFSKTARVAGRSIPHILSRMDRNDGRIMTEMIDNVRLRRPENVKLEINARRMAEAMGFNPNVPNRRLANIFDRLLSYNFKK